MDIEFKKLEQIEQDSKQAEAVICEWSAVNLTHKGYVRSVNEDSMYKNTEQGLWAVADGMGGHSRGDRASQIVVHQLNDFTRVESLADNIKELESRFLKANELCRNTFPHKVIGSTVAALFTYGSKCFFLWAGDSRIYRLRGSELKLMTEDHTVAQEKYSRGEMTQEEADDHHSAHVLTRAIGVHRRLRIEIAHSSVQSEDRYLICSDGMYKDINNIEIQSLLAVDGIDQSLDELVELALKRGGRDNITAIIVESN